MNNKYAKLRLKTFGFGLVLILFVQSLQPAWQIQAASVGSSILDGAQTTSQDSNSQVSTETAIHNYAYTLERGDCLSKGYRRLISKYIFVQNVNMSLGQRLYIEVKLSNADSRSSRIVFPGEVVVSGSDIDRYATQFTNLSDYVRSVWEQQTKYVNFKLDDTKVRVS